MKELLEYIIKHIVDYPDEVRISEVIKEKTILYKVRVASSDTKNVIGSRGNVANALRRILNIVVHRSGKYVSLMIIKQR